MQSLTRAWRSVRLNRRLKGRVNITTHLVLDLVQIALVLLRSFVVRRLQLRWRGLSSRTHERNSPCKKISRAKWSIRSAKNRLAGPTFQNPPSQRISSLDWRGSLDGNPSDASLSNHPNDKTPPSRTGCCKLDLGRVAVLKGLPQA